MLFRSNKLNILKLKIKKLIENRILKEDYSLPGLYYDINIIFEKTLDDFKEYNTENILETNNIFDNSTVTTPNRVTLKSRPKKRKMKITEEIQRQKNAKKRSTRKSTCSFCGYENHTQTNCPTKQVLETKYTLVKDIYDFIRYLENTVPILHPLDDMHAFSNIVG